ncbi:ImmA/IrrE family metallo-endopeptidase [Levilactobacillus namurensis]|uniref:ImmA/IrrE family metallo-endopeptidase n=1 Tax=Levilactobacillus namurensis TaxID=380393 RepID=UPI000466B0DB|nr:ImmA/IrrE family metallo-endopeptidase [Levilactobacillus namurensis]MDT7019334.1 ImmA/IrrE family metallo-endopeptidase [Levilactobacillus namurensis]WNN66066.1 ImmA/IrrE family metallo-endopeptidase [Levilactobacillus namurensis]
MVLSKLEQLIAAFSQYAAIIEVPHLREKTGTYGTFRVRDKKPYIFLEADQPEIDKRVILTEEFMHALTTVGVILDQQDLSNRKQELQARRLAYKTIISMDDLLHCYQMGLQYDYEIADELDVPVDFLKNAIEYFKTQLGEESTYKGYKVVISDTINFYPESVVK